MLYTMEWHLQGIREALNVNNFSFDEARHLLLANGFSAAESETRIDGISRTVPERSNAILASGDFMAFRVNECTATCGDEDACTAGYLHYERL
ncbi:MAG: hypothetical protein ACR5LD_08995 [Symbiopectobacterium sp.]